MKKTNYNPYSGARFGNFWFVFKSERKLYKGVPLYRLLSRFEFWKREGSEEVATSPIIKALGMPIVVETTNDFYLSSYRRSK